MMSLQFKLWSLRCDIVMCEANFQLSYVLKSIVTHCYRFRGHIDYQYHV